MLILGAKCGHFCCTPLPQGWFEMVATSHGDFLVSASGPVMFRFHERSQVFSSTSLKKNGLEIEEGNFSFFIFLFFFVTVFCLQPWTSRNKSSSRTSTSQNFLLAFLLSPEPKYTASLAHWGQTQAPHSARYKVPQTVKLINFHQVTAPQNVKASAD